MFICAQKKPLSEAMTGKIVDRFPAKRKSLPCCAQFRMDRRNVQLLSFRDAVGRQTGSMLKTRLSTALLRQSHGMSALPHANWHPLQPLRVVRRGYSARAIPARGVRHSKARPSRYGRDTGRCAKWDLERVAKLGKPFIAFVLDTVVLSACLLWSTPGFSCDGAR